MLKTKPPAERPAAANRKPYGYVLTLRALAGFAVEYPHHGAALRVLCVVAQHLNQDGVCRISQDTIAARLGISRQAVNKQLLILDNLDVLFRDGETGRLCEYTLAQSEYAERLAGDESVAARRKVKKAARAAARQIGKDPEQAQSAATNVVPLTVAPSREAGAG